MSLLLTGIALVLIIEGLAYALAPSLIARMLEALRAIPEPTVRIIGLLCIATGIALLWMLRGLGYGF